MSALGWLRASRIHLPPTFPTQARGCSWPDSTKDVVRRQRNQKRTFQLQRTFSVARLPEESSKSARRAQPGWWATRAQRSRCYKHQEDVDKKGPPRWPKKLPDAWPRTALKGRLEASPLTWKTQWPSRVASASKALVSARQTCRACSDGLARLRGQAPKGRGGAARVPGSPLRAKPSCSDGWRRPNTKREGPKPDKCLFKPVVVKKPGVASRYTHQKETEIPTFSPNYAGQKKRKKTSNPGTQVKGCPNFDLIPSLGGSYTKHSLFGIDPNNEQAWRLAAPALMVLTRLRGRSPKARGAAGPAARVSGGPNRKGQSPSARAWGINDSHLGRHVLFPLTSDCSRAQGGCIPSIINQKTKRAASPASPTIAGSPLSVSKSKGVRGGPVN